MPSETSPEQVPVTGPADRPDRPDQGGARRRALTWGAGALTFSVLTLGGFALGGPAPAGAADGTGSSEVTGDGAVDGMTNVTTQR